MSRPKVLEQNWWRMPLDLLRKLVSRFENFTIEIYHDALESSCWYGVEKLWQMYDIVVNWLTVLSPTNSIRTLIKTLFHIAIWPWLGRKPSCLLPSMRWNIPLGCTTVSSTHPTWPIWRDWWSSCSEKIHFWRIRATDSFISQTGDWNHQQDQRWSYWGFWYLVSGLWVPSTVLCSGWWKMIHCS